MVERNPSLSSQKRAAFTHLNELEIECINLFVSATRVLGIPKSVGEIYGFLYMSHRPLSLDQLVEHLQISKGSASQGLRFLRNLGAVKPVYRAGERKDYFQAEVALKKLVSGFIKEELSPHLESAGERLQLLRIHQEEIGQSNEELATFYKERVEKLLRWHQRASRLLPFAKKILGD